MMETSRTNSVLGFTKDLWLCLISPKMDGMPLAVFLFTVLTIN